MEKNCKTCKISKKLEDFYKDKNSKDKLQYSCKTCSNKLSIESQRINKEKNKEHKQNYSKNYYLNNKDKRKEYKKANEIKLKEYHKEYNKNYNINNKRKQKEYDTQYKKLRYNNDPLWKLQFLLRSRFNNALKNFRIFSSLVYSFTINLGLFYILISIHKFYLIYFYYQYDQNNQMIQLFLLFWSGALN